MDRTITYHSVTLQNKQTEPQKIRKNINKRNKSYLESADFFRFFSIFRKITVEGFVNQLIKKSGLIHSL